MLAIVGGRVIAQKQIQVKGQGVLDVADWNFKVNDGKQDVQTISLAETFDKSTLVNEKIAPGTSGKFNILVDGTGSEVDIEYNVALVNETNKPTNLKFIYENQEYNSIQELEKELHGVIYLKDENKSKVLPIKWVWNYETGKNEEEINTNDIIDTKEAMQNLNYTFDVIVTGTQMLSQQ